MTHSLTSSHPRRGGAGVVAAALLAASVASLVVAPQRAEADFVFQRQCESPTATSLWSMALYEDDRSGFFRQENFGELGTWPEDGEEEIPTAPGIRACFGSATPHSRNALIHWVPVQPDGDYEFVQPHPILLVPGAGDNSKRVFTFMAYRLAFLGYNVYAVTFAHPNGDNYQHAEQVANAVKLVSDLYDGIQVDVIAHSMGGIASRIYASNDGTVNWGVEDPRGAAYSNEGTQYRGDIRSLVLLGTPNGGADTSFRWSNSNFTRIYDTPVNAPVTWDTYYPFGTSNVFVTEDLTPYGYFAEQDYFPGQAQVVARWDDRIDLPGEITELGAMALQQDWYTTYEGGFGFVSFSQGIDEAIARGGDLISKVQSAGVDPDIKVFVAAGRNPILPLEYGAFNLSEEDRETYGENMESDWDRLERQWLDDVMPWHPAWGTDIQGVFEGRNFVGELSGPSDGLIFYDSVMDTSGITLRGAEVVETRAFDALNHLELTFASRLAAVFYGDEELSGELYNPELAAKYDVEENQLIEWIARSLFTEVEEQPGDDVGVDGGDDDADAGGVDADDEVIESDAEGDGGEDDASEGGDDGGGVEADVPSSGDGGGEPDDSGDEGSAGSGGAPRDGCAQVPGAGGGGAGGAGALMVALALALRWGRRRRRERQGAR